jgi:hypothetical protein
VILIATLAAGCSSARHVSTPTAPTSVTRPTPTSPTPTSPGPAVPATVAVNRGPRVRVTLKSGCPHATTAYEDVAIVADPQSRHALLPTATPTAGLVCHYRQDGGLTATHALDATDAASLATVVAGIDLTPDTFVHNCVADMGLANIVVLSYSSQPDVDLWWHASGCQTLDNGVIVAFQINNQGFAAFEAEITRLHA